MGGTVTLAFASRHPQRVTGLGLIDTTAWYGPDAPTAWEQRGEKARAEGLASLTAFQKTRWFSEQFLHDNPALVAERSEEHTSELQSLMRISYAVFCLKKKKKTITHITT